MTNKPWDQRLAAIVVRPLAATPVHPNHLTVLSLVLGLGAAILFAQGDPRAADWAALLFMVAVFGDHTDGALARLTAKTSRFGHYFDYLAGAANYTMLFIGIGFGLSGGALGSWAFVLGLAAGLSNPIIVTLRLTMEIKRGPATIRHPSFAGFEIEDFIYLIGPITWVGGLKVFFLAYGLGTLGYLLWTVALFLRGPGGSRG